MQSDSRYVGVILSLFTVAAVASSQTMAPGTGDTQSGPLLEEQAVSRISSKGDAPAAFVNEIRSFGRASNHAHFEAVLAEGRGRLQNRMGDASRTHVASGAQPNVMVAAAGSVGDTLTLGQPHTLPFLLPTVYVPTLFTGDYGFEVRVPVGAQQLEISLNARPADAKVTIYGRCGQDVTLSAGHVVADYASPGQSATERIVITPVCSGAFYIALGVATTGVPVSGSITILAGTGFPEGTALKSGIPSVFSLPAVNAHSLFTGQYGFWIDVPAGVHQLEITLATATPGVDVDLYASFAHGVTVVSGRAVADFSSTGPTGSERILIDASSAPPLHYGRYFIALGLYTTGKAASGVIKATVDGYLTWDYSFPAVSRPTLFTSDYGFRIVVPPGVSMLGISIVTATPGADVNLYVRLGRDIEHYNGRPVADYVSEGPTGNERITIANPAPGTYYIGYGVVTTGVAISGSGFAVMAPPVVTPPPTSTQTCDFSLPAVWSNTLFHGDYGCLFAVPSGTSRLEIRMTTAPPNVDVYLFVRSGQDIEVLNGHAVADFSAPGDEPIVITPSSYPPLRAGTYFVGFGVLTRGTPINGTVTATVSR